jgi:hypothetical protein
MAARSASARDQFARDSGFAPHDGYMGLGSSAVAYRGAPDSPDGPVRAILVAGDAVVIRGNPVREKSEFAWRFNADSAVQPPRQNYSTSVLQKYVILSRHPASMLRAYRDRHDT